MSFLYILSWVYTKHNGEEAMELFYGNTAIEAYRNALPVLLYKWKELNKIPVGDIPKGSVDLVESIGEFSRSFPNMLITDINYKHIKKYGDDIGQANVIMLFNLYFDIQGKYHEKPEWHTIQKVDWDKDQFVIGTLVVFEDSTGSHFDTYHYINSNIESVNRDVAKTLIQWWYLFTDDQYRKQLIHEDTSGMVKIHMECKNISSLMQSKGRKGYEMLPEIEEYVRNLTDKEVSLLVEAYFLMIPFCEKHNEMWFVNAIP